MSGYSNIGALVILKSVYFLYTTMQVPKICNKSTCRESSWLTQYLSNVNNSTPNKFSKNPKFINSLNSDTAMKRITSNHLLNWAPTRDCQDILPLLIRKLIRASAVNVQRLLIPVGDNVILPGFDGTVELIDGNEYLPAGHSVWEIGSGKGFKEKGEKDFTKRSNAIDKTEAANISFVFVTPYIWINKEEWVKAKKATGVWKDVLVIDGLILEDWIEQCQSVGAWLSKYLQLPLGSIQPLEQFWQEWSKSLKYSISSTLVVAGRDKGVESFTDFLLNQSAILSVKAYTAQEAIAFCSAVIERLDTDLQEKFYSIAVIVQREEDFRVLASHKNPLILIANFEVGSLTNVAVRNGHHVIVPIGNDITTTTADIELPRIKRTGFEKGLEEMGFTSDETQQITRDSGQSLSVLRRLLSFEKNMQPGWAKNGNHTTIIPALLAGMWDEQKEEDKALVSLLAGEAYESHIKKLSRWKVEKDPPVFQLRSIWRLTSAFDAWSILTPFVTKTDLANFRTAFLTALPEIHPALELDPERRYLASLYGKAPKFSHSLKEGLCQSLILVAVVGERFKLNADISSQHFADGLVRDLLSNATGDRWCTLHRLLPLLAEASPASFLSAVEESLKQAEPPVMKMFGDITHVFSSTSYYTGLLWALENLLVSPIHLLRTTLVLGRLAALDPGGNLTNRPSNSLRAAYMPWYNQTGADFTLRKNVLKKLAACEPEIAWKLFLDISPQDHTTVSPIHQCKWRFDPHHLERSVKYEQVWDFNSFLFDQQLLLAKDDPQKAAVLVNCYPDISPAERGKLLHFLNDFKTTHSSGHELIWDNLRQLLSNHREHSEQLWALPENELTKIDELYHLYLPKDLKWRYRFLFEDSWPYFPEGFKRKALSHEEKEEFFGQRRSKAFKEIYKAEGLDGICALLKLIKNTHQLSKAAAAFPFSNEEEKTILSLVDSEARSNELYFAQDYIFHKALTDETWPARAWEVIKNNYNDEKIAFFFLGLPQKPYCWNLLESARHSAQSIYWQRINPWFNKESADNNLYVIQKLKEQGRYTTLIEKLGYICDEFSSEELSSILTGAGTTTPEEGVRLNVYNVGRFFKVLHTRNDLPEEQMVRLEWMYLAFLSNARGEHKPQHLLKALTESPTFFVDVVSYVYRPGNGTEEDYSEEEAAKRFQHFTNARNLLEAWRSIPGMKEDGSIDKKVLHNWIIEARIKAIEKNRVYGTDNEIGKLLACCSRKKDNWPPEEICEIIDDIHSDVILTNFRLEIFNSRGVSVRSPYAGGEQERSLARFFKNAATRIQSRFPFTASALLDLAKGYEYDAKDEDESAHLDELR